LAYIDAEFLLKMTQTVTSWSLAKCMQQNTLYKNRYCVAGQFGKCKRSNKHFVLWNENKHATYQNAMMSTRTTMAIWMNLLEQTSSSLTFKWLHLLCFRLAAESLLVTENYHHMW